MRREKRTVYLMPDLAQRVDETAAGGGISPSAIVETALDEHFTRESMYLAIEALTRRVSELDERLAAQQAMLARIDTAIGAVGRGLVVIRDIVKPPAAPAEQPPQPVVQDRDSGSTPAGRPAGWLRLGRR
ncbi:hypothetical protein SAE02_69750 [Skermanella aerolata]|uniref:Uncharacterized protein n=1 Tax=Skermanella aerolata TaxID=393310 RepID=A0A512E2A6_9PROT|nr:hypothetical protein [Skermanella aerolata]KJB91223.1 CopG family transcripitonal regulator [Skermanella aerolata KACC 11604]GEO42827.1 hypothetical protein SAE02_69750 [Skermanella aerolata]